MNTALKTLVASVALIGTVGATSVPAAAYQPAPTPQQLACDSYGQNYANYTVGPQHRPAFVGALIGGAAGFFIGGYGFGAPGWGAAIGAGVGALGGLAVGNQRWANAYNAAFSACMQGYYLAY